MSSRAALLRAMSKGLPLACALLATNARGEGGANRVRPSAWSPEAPRTPSRSIDFDATNPNAELQVREPVGWRIVCTGRCNASVRAGATYRVAGSGVTGSSDFVIEESSYSLVLHARTGSSDARAAGYLLVPVGGVTLVAALFVFAAAHVNPVPGGCPASGCSHGSTTGAAAAIVAVAGAGLLVTGIALVAENSSRLDFSTSAPPPPPTVKILGGLELGADGFHF